VAKRILDKNISFSNYATFKKCRISENGKEITFILANEASYQVPIEYFLQWSKHPHHVVKDGRSVKWREGRAVKKLRKNLKFVKWRRMLEGVVVRVYLSDSTAYDIPWDAVLMACEKKYEHFGGLTEKSKEITYTWHKIKRKRGR